MVWPRRSAIWKGKAITSREGGESANPDLILGQKLLKMQDIPASERVYLDGHLDFIAPIAVTIQANTFLTPLTVSSATVIARYGSTPVATMKKVGRGQVYYFGTNLGASIEAGDDRGIDLLRSILSGVLQPAVTADKVRPRLIEGPTRSPPAVVNTGAEDELASVRLPARYRHATDLYSNEALTVRDNAIQLVVPFEGVSVLRLE